METNSSQPSSTHSDANATRVRFLESMGIPITSDLEQSAPGPVSASSSQANPPATEAPMMKEAPVTVASIETAAPASAPAAEAEEDGDDTTASMFSNKKKPRRWKAQTFRICPSNCPK